MGRPRTVWRRSRKKGYIELCTEPYFAPYEYVDPNKSGDEQYQGMDIEVAKYIADKIGVELKITALDFTAVLAGVADGKYDFAISAIAYAPSRAEAMRLSDVYYSSNTGYGFIVRTEDVDKYNDLDSFEGCRGHHPEAAPFRRPCITSTSTAPARNSNWWPT